MYMYIYIRFFKKVWKPKSEGVLPRPCNIAPKWSLCYRNEMCCEKSEKRTENANEIPDTDWAVFNIQILELHRVP
jgi:hypothetical protein